MLELFREKIVKFGAQLLFLLLIFSFLAWGVGDYLGASGGRGSSTTVAQVGSQSILTRDFQREMQDQIARMRQMFGEGFNVDQARAMGIDESILQSMIQDALYTQGANKLGLLVNDQVVLQEIRRDPTFQTPAGFDRTQFESALRQAGFSEGQYVALMRSDILRQQFLSPIMMGKAAPQTLVDSLYKYRNEKRIAQIITLPHAKITGIPAPTDEQLADYHKKNAGTYTTQEVRQVTIVQMRPEDVVDEIDVPDGDIQSYYDDHVDEFSSPERRTITQALFTDEAAARAAADRVSKGEDFDKVAQENGGGSLGTLAKQEVPIPELADTAFTILPNTVSDPVQSSLGWHLVRVIDIQSATQRPLADVRDDIHKRLALDKAPDVLYGLAGKFEDELGGGATAEQAAAKLKLNVMKLDSVDHDGRDPAGNRYNDLAPDMLKAAFDTPEGKDSALGDLAEGGHYIVHVDKVIPATLRPLDEVKDRVRNDWTEAQRAEKADTVVKEMMDDIKGGKILADVAAAHGATLAQTQPFTRTREGLDLQLPGSLIPALFKAAQGEPVSAPADEAHVIGVVSQIVSPDPTADNDAVNRLKDELSGQLVNDLSTSLSGALRERLSVSIDRDAVDSAF